MAFEAAKEILQQANSPEERSAAVEAALDLGMPLSVIETYLDWLEVATSSLEPNGPADLTRAKSSHPRRPK